MCRAPLGWSPRRNATSDCKPDRNQTTGVNVTITSPEEGASIPAGNVTVEVNLTNFTLVEPTGQPMPRARPPALLPDARYRRTQAPLPSQRPAAVISTNLSYTWENVTPGEHNFSVQVVHNDHTPLIPLVYDTVNVTVGGNATGNATVVGLSAKDIAFNVSTITVPAGANVTVHFTNEDSGIPHNFAVYTDSSATEKIFSGEIITGPATTTYNFTAPDKPGTYFFRCDVHPVQMTGNFVVQ